AFAWRGGGDVDEHIRKSIRRHFIAWSSGITQAGFAILERVESGLCEAPGSIREPHVARRVVNANNAGRLKVRPRYGVARLTISKKHDGRRYGFGFTLLTAAGRL